MSDVFLGYVYEIFDKRTNECIYVGSTAKSPLKRWGNHIYFVFYKRRNLRPFHKYMRAQGPDHFDFRVREEVFFQTNEDLRKREQVWMDQLKPKHNSKRAYSSAEYTREHQRLRNRVFIICECGQRISRGNISCHRKTAKHARQLKSLRRVEDPSTKACVSAPRPRAPSGSEASDPEEA